MSLFSSDLNQGLVRDPWRVAVVMIGVKILFVNLHPGDCRDGCCRSLSEWASALSQKPSLAIRTSLDSSEADQPELLIVRPTPKETFAAICAVVRSRWPEIPMLALFCGPWTGLSAAAACLNDSIDDFVCCPFRQSEFAARVDRLLAFHEATAPRAVQPGFTAPDFVVGRSPRFLKAVERLRKMAESEATILITGETGTGKEVFARALHYMSELKGHPFVPVNCGSLPDHLLENELFGHVKGAYTDASTNETGLLTAAEGGTLFLDEVDSLSMPAQVKLLRFLQSREYRPLGSARTLVANVRVIAASNAKLLELVRGKQFREDLYYRLNVLSVQVPPLRERTEDIGLLAAHFLRCHRPRNQPAAVRLSPAALLKLEAYDWPGNVRELEAVIQRAIVLTRSPTVGAADIDLPVDISEVHDQPLRLNEAKRMVIGRFEKAYLIGLLSANHGNLSHAAREAGKERRAFQRLVRKHKLDRAQFREVR